MNGLDPKWGIERREKARSVGEKEREGEPVDILFNAAVP